MKVDRPSISTRPSGPGRWVAVAFAGPRIAALTLVGGMLVSVVLFGLFWPYWRIADQDLIVAYQGLLFNDGLPQEYFDHTGYLYFLAVAEWYRMLHLIGVLDVDALSQLPPARDAAAFDAAWQHLMEAGRLCSLAITAAYVCLFVALMRRLVGDWRVAHLCGIALAFSGGVAMLMRIMRTELLSSAFVTMALLLTLLAGLRPRDGPRFMLLAAAGLCASLAVVTKVQALLPALAIPVIALAFGDDPRSQQTAPIGRERSWWRAGAWSILALAVAVPATLLLWQGIADLASASAGYPTIGISGVYQPMIALWVAAAMAVYALCWRIEAPDTIAAMGAILLGVAVGLLTLLIRYHPGNVIAVANPIEHMFVFATSDSPLTGATALLSSKFFSTLASGLWAAVSHHTFILSPSHRPTLMLEWLAIAGAVVAWRRGDRVLPARVAVLVLAAWGMDTLFWFRGLKQAYFAYSDPLLIIAAALTAMRFAELAGSLRVQRYTLGLVAVTVVWAHAEPVKATFSRHTPKDACSIILSFLKRVETFPFCRDDGLTGGAAGQTIARLR